MKRNKTPFSEEEINLLQTIFENSPKKEIIRQFAPYNRSPVTVFRMAKNLGLKRNKKIISADIAIGSKKHENCWSESELNCLKTLYPSSSIEKLKKAFPDRSLRAIRLKALKLKIHRNKKIKAKEINRSLINSGFRWSPEKDKILRELYPNKPKEFLIQQLNEKWRSIKRRARKLNLSRNKKRVRLDKIAPKKLRKDSCSPEEISLLKEIFENNTKETITEKFKGAGFNRSYQSICRFAKIMGLNPFMKGKKFFCPWTPEEDKILLEFYEKSSKKEILKKLSNRVWRAIYKRSVTLGLHRFRDGTWTESENALLKEFYANTSKKELEEKLPGRSWKAITYRGCNVFRIFRSKEIIQEKFCQTNLARRGVKYPTQSLAVQEKVKKTVQKHYKVENVFQAEEIKEKSKETNLKIFGVKYPQQSPDIKKKTEETCQEKYGVSNPFQLIDRVQNGMKKKHGVKSPLQNKEIQAKQQATNIKKYGVPISTQNEKVRNKSKETNLIRYGSTTPLGNKEIQQKIRETNFSKYGFDNPMKSTKVQNKVRESLYKHGSQKCSKQQYYLVNLFKGKLNFPVENCNVDILLDEKIICEYDGGGHTLSVKLGTVNHKNFYDAERKRDLFLKSKGYSIIRIISTKDLLPVDDILLQMIAEAKTYLSSGHSWIHYDIDRGKVSCNLFQKEYKYGNLREIT